MRLLALSSWWPEPADNGIRIRIGQLLGALAREHSVHLLSLAEPPAGDIRQGALAAQCASVGLVPHAQRPIAFHAQVSSLWRTEPASVRVNWSAAFARLVAETAAAVRPEAVIAFELAMAPYARLVGGAARILDDLETTRMREQFAAQPAGPRRLRAWLTWEKHRRYVHGLLHDFSACTVVSAPELEDARQVAPARVVLQVIPNGATITGAPDDWGPPEPDTLVYPGALSYDANRDAMAYFIERIWPAVRAARPRARLRITGRATSEERALLPAAPGVELTGHVPEIRQLIARSWAEVVPLRAGSGTRLKVLEALAVGTPVVTTSKGAEGLDLAHDRELLIADTAAEFAAATVRLLEQPALRARLAAAGAAAVRERYDWRVIGGQLNRLVEQVVQGQQAWPTGQLGSESRGTPAQGAANR